MIVPFEGWVYRELPRVAPVVDALSVEELATLRQDPWQAIHVALPENPNEVSHRWEGWKEAHVVRREPLPTLYAYSQTFYRYGSHQAFQRVGVVGLLPVEAELLPHEKTLPERVEGIKAILRKVPLQSTPVHVLAEGGWVEVLPLLQMYLRCPLFSVGAKDGVMHRWSPIHHREHQIQLQAKLRGRMLIADGHHRWQAVREEGLRFLLVYLTPMRDESLYIVPAHRLLVGDFSLEEAERYFEVRLSAKRVPLWRELEGLRYGIGLVSPEGRTYTARLRPSLWPLLGERPLIAWLQEWFWGREAKMEFLREPARLLQLVVEKRGWGFVLPPVRIEEVEKAAVEGKPLPPKATYFFPKVLSGIAFYEEGYTGVGVAPA